MRSDFSSNNSILETILLLSCPELATKLEALRSIVEVINYYLVIIVSLQRSTC